MKKQPLNKNLKIPLYVQLRELILGRIQSGEFKPGDIVPTEYELMEEFSVSRNVVRQAIGELVDGGYLIRKKAIGTFVSTPSANLENLSYQEVFRESVLRQGGIPSTKVLSMEVLDADPDIAARLEVVEGTRVFRIVRLRYSDDVPVALSESVLPYSRCSFVLGHRFQTDSLHRILSSRYDTRIYRSIRQLDARLVRAQETELLGVPQGSVVKCIIRKSYNRTNMIVESTIVVYRSDFEIMFETVEPS